MSSEEFLEWLAYDRMSPGEPERGDAQAALTAMVIANSNRKPGTAPYKLQDFLLSFDSPQKEVSPAQVLRTQLETWRSIVNENFAKATPQ